MARFFSHFEDDKMKEDFGVWSLRKQLVQNLSLEAKSRERYGKPASSDLIDSTTIRGLLRL
jgi:hypothetical protein